MKLGTALSDRMGWRRAVTPQRLAFLLEHCSRGRRRRGDRNGHYADVARFLDISLRTLERWLAGEVSISRKAAIILEIFHAYPEITAAKVDRLLARGERGDGNAGGPIGATDDIEKISSR